MPGFMRDFPMRDTPYPDDLEVGDNISFVETTITSHYLPDLDLRGFKNLAGLANTACVK